MKLHPAIHQQFAITVVVIVGVLFFLMALGLVYARAWGHLAILVVTLFYAGGVWLWARKRGRRVRSDQI